MEHKGAIFDLDGVIVDTARFHYLAWKELADEMGFEFTLVQNERLKGISRMQSLEILLEIGNISLTMQEKEKLAERKNKRYIDMLMGLTEDDILPGVKEFLNALRRSGVKIALGSASKNACFILGKLGLTEAFDTIVDGNVVSKAKPNPEIFLAGAKGLKLEPAQCVVFEDSVAGIEAAKRGGMYAVGVGDKNMLSGADFVIENFKGYKRLIRNFKEKQV